MSESCSGLITEMRLTDNMVALMSPKDRKLIGLKTRQEHLEKQEAKSERQLQRQIVQYLRLRGIEPLWHRTDKRSHATIGWPDITAAVKVHGIPMPLGIEVKFGTGTLSREQTDMHARLQASPNCWRIVVIRNFTEVVDLLRELDL